MAVMEITVIPIGTSSSISGFVARALELVKESGLKYELTAMGTLVEGETKQLLELAGKIHHSVLDAGAPRVVTLIKIDDRRDKRLSLEGKIRSVREKLDDGVKIIFARKADSHPGTNHESGALSAREG